MTSSFVKYISILVCTSILILVITSCKSKKKLQTVEAPVVVTEDTSNIKCRLDYKNARALSRYVKENEFKFEWINAKANVESNVDGNEESFDVRVKCKKDSAIFITIEKLSIDIAKILITRDSVKMRIDIKKQYFVGDFKYINELLNADLDFDLLQAVLFGNSAEFQEDETKLKPVTDRQNCHYLLSTERKRRLKRIQTGASDVKNSLQTLTLNPDNYKILKNEFIESTTNRIFIANYSNFTQKDSVYAPYHVDIDIVAQKKANIKIDYVRMEKNTPQKLTLNIPSKYDPIQIQKK
ncbi:hypothetical protein CNR22_09860 [Sphingobacteriaceae bacterium]|nr:hypothetical protein CNR22_09860 [Sphingobacteriaceae bacterium]